MTLPADLGWLYNLGAQSYYGLVVGVGALAVVAASYLAAAGSLGFGVGRQS